jgi:beta-lactam-binding protein with PASTA domain
MHIALIVVFIGLNVFLVMSWLSHYTRHGETISVPELKGKSLEEVHRLLQNNDLVFEVTDSVYADEVDRGVVVTQTPHSGKAVKKGRTIFLTVNSMLPEMVELPDLMGKSLRIAVPILEITGLKLKSLEYKPDESCTDCVIGMKYDGDEIEAGSKIRKGAEVTIILGQQSREETSVPNLLGMQYRDARDIILGQSLNIGQVLLCTGCETSEDTSMAYVINQIPDAGDDARLGAYVEVFLTTDSTAASALQTPIDTLSDEIP